ncbi:MAG TPA: hypothetical protein PLE54_18615 [Burkholderiaceae bacterium]|nr:hypothetical protein [Burkholderiaceae bacterium]
MPTLMRTVALGFATLAGLHCGAALAGAEDRDGNPIFFEKVEKAAVERANPLGIRPVEADVLARRRGGADVVNDMLLKGVVADNRASNLTTGSNVISDGSFTGMVGLPLVVQNTGNGVLIQNATIINLQVK